MSGTGRARGRGGRGKRAQEQEPPPPGAVPVQQPAQPPTGSAGAAPGPPVGRGRARGQAARQAGAQQIQHETPQQPPPVAEDVAPPMEGHIGGRGTLRGGGRERPAAGGDIPEAEMAGLSLDRRPRREAWRKYEDRAYKSSSTQPWGTFGDKVQLVANFFKVTLPSERKIYQYAVDFSPPIENARVKFALIATYSHTLGDAKCFDGGLLYLCKILQDEVTTFTATRNTDGTSIRVTITLKNEVPSDSPQFLQIANLMFKRAQVAVDMSKIRDHYYNLSLSVKVPRHRLEVVPGFITSILAYEAGSLLNVDVTHKIIRMDTFLDCMYDLYESQRFGNEEQFHAVALKKFVGTIVMTRYNNKTYKVDDIFWQGRPSSTFEKNGQKITYEEYYKTHWNIDIKDQNQPLLVTRPTERDFRRGDKQNMYLLPELCTITGLSDEARTDFGLLKDLAVHTRIGPTERVQSLEKFINELNANSKVKDVFRPWQISIDSQAIRLPGRQMPPEQLNIRSKTREFVKISYDVHVADWSKEMRNRRLLNAAALDNWVVVYHEKAHKQTGDIIEGLRKVCSELGMVVNPPVKVALQFDRNDAYLQAIRLNLNPDVKMVLCVVPNNKKDRYDAIKKCCCIDNPVPSQVVLQKTISKAAGLLSVATKIGIQMNCKMGGEVWSSDIPLKGLMVVGLDAYHDSQNKGSSVGAMVASVNRDCTRYYSRTETHPSKTEEMANLSVLLAGALKRYHEVNGAPPSRIIVYRDGVGDGQLNTVFETEKLAINTAISNSGGPNYKPTLAYIVVKKRINARLFSGVGGNFKNPNPGTVVDRVITKEPWYDFFLVSQSVKQGTVTPTSYNILFDETGLQPDHMQRLAYKLTHLYFNWQGTIRVPAPCQYAHKLAFLQGQSLHREPSGYLADKLFYL